MRPLLPIKHLLFCILLTGSCNLSALTVRGTVMTVDGDPVAEAVITAVGTVKSKPSATSPRKIDQRNREFVAHILAVRVGESVTFPNSDDIHHHIYSFSPANPFEIQLYKGVPAHPTLFNKTGVVVLGCNIHDWMVGYVYVTDAPYFTQTDSEGQWTLTVPADNYTLTLWHPDLDSPNNVQVQQLKLTAENTTPIEQKITLKPVLRTGKPPEEESLNSSSYN